MKFEDSLNDNVVLFELSGKIMGGDETTMFHGRIHEYMTQGKKNIIIDLAKVDWMNSVGLGMLISALTTVRNGGGRLVLSRIDKIEQILVITRLISVFEHYDSSEKALASFKK
jgi:anti-sigma B factor antagonist